jgi:hypothetical protein
MTIPPPPNGPRWKTSKKSSSPPPAANPFSQPPSIPPSSPSDPLFSAPKRPTGRKFGEFTEEQIRRAAAELARRSREAIRIFEPLITQQAFFDSHAYIRLLLGGNRCLGGETEIYDPSLEKTRPVSEIVGGHHVRALDTFHETTRPSYAGRPFVKAWDRLYRFDLSNGQSFVATLGHQCLGLDGRYRGMGFFSGATCTETGIASFDVVQRHAMWGEHDAVFVTKAEFVRWGEVWDFTVDCYHNYIHAGICSHNSGKTTCGAIECARCVTNYTDRYPKKGTFVIVGKDFDTISAGVWPRLFEPGSFKTIRDRASGTMRAVRPWELYDKEHPELWKPAEPILPHRLIDKIVWLNKGKGIPTIVHMKTGWQIRIYSGESIPKAGFEADVGWMDEEVKNELWERELRMRLVDRNGSLYWTATPENSTPALYGLYARFLAGDKDVSAFTLSSENHPHHSDEALRRSQADMTDDDYQVKVLGHFRLGSAIVFPEFDWKKLAVDEFEIPSNWTRYLAIDPGFNPCSVLFLAVPPDDDPKHGGHVYVYDELVVERSSAEILAERLKEKIGDQRFELFLIDRHGGRLSEAGSGENSEDQYRRTFKAAGIESRRQGSAFTAGCDDSNVRINAARAWMRGENPILRIFKRCAVTKWQTERYHYGRDRHGIITNKPVKRNDHLCDMLGTFADYKPQHVKARGRKADMPIFKKLADKAKRRKDRKDSTFGPVS